ncbi:hypothetical protein [Candidatus Deferrimicrobium sp.]|uniref:hypothetical protein n=1 Tax=Candidatus Deferrimicrobium sp. TaxID=3060586 RepID=UPI002ECFE3D2
MKHLTLSTWFGDLRNLLPAASPDLSPPAVARWPAYVGATCPRCGAFEASGAAPHFPCGLCAAAPPPFDAARSLFGYAGDVREAIVATKYAGRPYPVDAVALRLSEAFEKRWRDLIPDADPPTVVPIPTHPWKLPAGVQPRADRVPSFAALRFPVRSAVAFENP